MSKLLVIVFNCFFAIQSYPAYRITVFSGPLKTREENFISLNFETFARKLDLFLRSPFSTFVLYIRATRYTNYTGKIAGRTSSVQFTKKNTTTRDFYNWPACLPATHELCHASINDSFASRHEKYSCV